MNAQVCVHDARSFLPNNQPHVSNLPCLPISLLLGCTVLYPTIEFHTTLGAPVQQQRPCQQLHLDGFVNVDGTLFLVSIAGAAGMRHASFGMRLRRNVMMDMIGWNHVLINLRLSSSAAGFACRHATGWKIHRCRVFIAGSSGRRTDLACIVRESAVKGNVHTGGGCVEGVVRVDAFRVAAGRAVSAACTLLRGQQLRYVRGTCVGGVVPGRVHEPSERAFVHFLVLVLLAVELEEPSWVGGAAIGQKLRKASLPRHASSCDLQFHHR
mmetsp:Transcript_20384/g.56723  ORF Transcript_20384/g.56723 Transcript_20384/m.56723 type:complete len:268 (+) Transcript_20384:177-980(+)